MRFRSPCLVVAFALCGGGVSVLVARSGGADAGFSGGPAGYEFAIGNCTACHIVDPAIYPGPGGVEIVDPPRRYRSGAVYDLRVRVSDVEQVGAGFEISVENADGHHGAFIISDATNTQQAGSGAPVRYVTHTQQGLRTSEEDWVVNGGSFAYSVRWEAPDADVGLVTLFAAGNATDGSGLAGDRYYAGHATLAYAVPGDADGDTDADLSDFARLQRCMDIDTRGGGASGAGCTDADFDGDGVVSLFDAAEFVVALGDVVGGPVSTVPGDYVLADAVRGGLLYDKWWVVNGAPAPSGLHPLYPPESLQSGSATFRCKECHGWDYKGVDGAYGSGSHFTGIKGVHDTTLTPQAIFDLLKADPVDTPNGHNMDAFGMSDRDIWDVVKMTLEGTVDTDEYIDPTTPDVFISTQAGLGGFWYQNVCSSCHDDPNTFEQGTLFNFGDESDPVYVGTVANENPWEFLHKIRFGQPGTSMAALDLLGWDVDRAAAVGAFAVTLPAE